jgi:phage antirepressor YoqD-like protein
MSRKTKEEFAENKLTQLIQHTEPDVRFYEDPESGINYPSVTTILEMIPKDEFLEQWKDKEGSHTVNQVLYEASVSGTKVHNAIEDLCTMYLTGQDAFIEWFDENGYKKYKTHEWEGILRFCDFFNKYVDEVLLTESKLKSDNLFVSGTVDNVFRLKDSRIALIDHKFANNLSDKYSVQSWAYKEMFEETYGMKVDVRGNLWLKAHTRGEDKKGKKIQGKGWQFVEHTEDERDSKVFGFAHGLFMDKWRNKEIAPSHKIYNAIAKLN